MLPIGVVYCDNYYGSRQFRGKLAQPATITICIIGSACKHN